MIINRLLTTLAITFGLINTLLGLLGQKDIAVYFIFNAIVYLTVTVLYVYLNPKARRSLNAVSAIIFAGFLLIVAIKVMEILR